MSIIVGIRISFDIGIILGILIDIIIGVRRVRL